MNIILKRINKIFTGINGYRGMSMMSSEDLQLRPAEWDMAKAFKDIPGQIKSFLNNKFKLKLMKIMFRS